MVSIWICMFLASHHVHCCMVTLRFVIQFQKVIHIYLIRHFRVALLRPRFLDWRQIPRLLRILVSFQLLQPHIQTMLIFLVVCLCSLGLRLSQFIEHIILFFIIFHSKQGLPAWGLYQIVFGYGEALVMVLVAIVARWFSAFLPDLDVSEPLLASQDIHHILLLADLIICETFLTLIIDAVLHYRLVHFHLSRYMDSFLGLRIPVFLFAQRRLFDCHRTFLGQNACFWQGLYCISEIFHICW